MSKLYILLDTSTNMISMEIRNWVLFILAFIGFVVTIKTFMNSIQQRKIENTLKTLGFIKSHIGRQQIETFIKLFHANNELKGLNINEFEFDNGNKETIETMFSEGGCGNGDIQNMVELFNLLSPTFESQNMDIIWYEYGQIMLTLYAWTKYLDELEGAELNSKFYTKFNYFMNRNWEKMLQMPMKHYTYIE